MNLYEQMLSILNNENGIAWDYYQAPPMTANPIENPSESWEFIKGYFNSGQKGRALDFSPNGPDNLLQLSQTRSIHTVSTFFIGLLICHWLYKGKEPVFGHDGVELPFRYLWFLASLYHDFGYVVEDDKGQFPIARRSPLNTRNNSIRGYRELVDIREKLDMCCTIYTGLTKRKLGANCCVCQCYDSSRNNLPACRVETVNKYMNSRNRYISINGKPDIHGYRYSSEQMAKYFRYCLDSADKPFYNHGIIGGHLFFDQMVKNYVDSYHLACREGNANISFDDFEYGFPRRFFKKEQFPIFAYIADCIIAHNVWAADEKSRAKYIEYGLDFLLPENFRKISFEENPVLYILAIADTIEPCKCYCPDEPNVLNESVHKVWKGIDVGYEEEDRTITITVIDEDLDARLLMRKAEGLAAWVNVEVEREANTIKIKQL